MAEEGDAGGGTREGLEGVAVGEQVAILVNRRAVADGETLLDLEGAGG